MGRTVVVEERVKDELSTIKESQQVRTGLLLGQLTEAKDYVSTAVPTPSLQELGATEDKEANGESIFSDWWIVGHATQVYGLLPGGINIVGMFICCPSHSLPPLQARISKILADIAAGQEFKGHQPHQHLTFLHYCYTKKKFKCQTINLGDAQAGFRSAEFKFKSHMSQWCKVEGVVCVDTECVLPPASPGKEKGKEVSSSKLDLTQARAGMKEVLQSFQDAAMTLRGQVVRQTSTPLLQPTSKKSKSSSTTLETIQAALYLRKSAALEPPVVISGKRAVSFRGSMALLAYLHPKATCGEAIAAVKQDACRSLLARLQAAVEAESDSFLEQLPVRVALSSTSSHFPFTEFSLPHEDTQECVSRAGDLLGVSSESLVATPLEQFADSAKKAGEGTPPRHLMLPTQQEKEYAGMMKRYYGIASLLASLSVVIISISVYIMLQ